MSLSYFFFWDGGGGGPVGSHKGGNAYDVLLWNFNHPKVFGVSTSILVLHMDSTE